MHDPVDYIQWIDDTIRANPHLSRAGLAKHMNRHKSAVTAMMQGKRSIKAEELDQIARYLGTPVPHASAPTPMPRATEIQIEGRVGPGWYERGSAPPASGTIAPVLAAPPGRQVAYLVDTAIPQLGLTPGCLIVAVVLERKRPPAGVLVIGVRERAGLENMVLARVGADGTLAPVAGAASDDVIKPIAQVIELRVPVA